jgi:hypothetical protein
VNFEPTVRVNPYTDVLIPPPPPKRHSKLWFGLVLVALMVSVSGVAAVSYGTGVSSVPTPATPPPVDAGATAAANYNLGLTGQATADSNMAAGQATAAYNQGWNDDNNSYLKWVHDKCTKDGNGNYTVYMKNGELWCY